ncbi:MAG: hypothetical protein R3C46_10460 [Hyphomonadaceae bacterium]
MIGTSETLQVNPGAAAEDLAFLRSVLHERAKLWRRGGILYAAAGLLYGVETLVGVVDLLTPIPVPSIANVIAAVVASGGFVVVMIYVLVKGRREMKQKGVASRAINAAFAGIGAANAVAAIVFAVAAIRAQDMMLWLLFPVVAAAFQGAAWFAVAGVARRMWMRLVSLGWFAAALGAGLSLPSIASYLVVLTIALFALMVAPGLAMMRMGEDEA